MIDQVPYTTTSVGDYSMSIADGVAHVSILRTSKDELFNLKDLLAHAGLRPAGKRTVEYQCWYFTTYTKQEMPNFTGWASKLWLKMRGKPLTTTIENKNTHRRNGAQTNLPSSTSFYQAPTFEYAYTKVSVPVKAL